MAYAGSIAMCLVVALMSMYMLHDMYIAKQKTIQLAEKTELSKLIDSNMKYEDLREFVNQIITFKVRLEIATKGYTNKTDAEMSVIMDDILLDICTYTELSISDEMRRQFSIYVTPEYLSEYILQASRIIFMDNVERKKGNVPAI